MECCVSNCPCGNSISLRFGNVDQCQRGVALFNTVNSSTIDQLLADVGVSAAPAIADRVFLQKVLLWSDAVAHSTTLTETTGQPMECTKSIYGSMVDKTSKEYVKPSTATLATFNTIVEGTATFVSEYVRLVSSSSPQLFSFFIFNLRESPTVGLQFALFPHIPAHIAFFLGTAPAMCWLRARALDRVALLAPCQHMCVSVCVIRVLIPTEQTARETQRQNRVNYVRI